MIIFPITTYTIIILLFFSQTIRFKVVYYIKWFSIKYLQGWKKIIKEIWKAAKVFIIFGIIIIVPIIYYANNKENSGYIEMQWSTIGGDLASWLIDAWASLIKMWIQFTWNILAILLKVLFLGQI